MMKNRLLISAIGLITLLSLTKVCLAGDSFSIAVSCSIPIVPGLNAPFIEEKTALDHIPVQQTTQNPQEETQTDSPEAIQEETEEEVRLADGKTASVVVQTLYSR